MQLFCLYIVVCCACSSIHLLAKNDPATFDMDYRFPFKQAQEEADAKEDNKNIDTDASIDEEKQENSSNTPQKEAQANNDLLIKRILMLKKRKAGPSEGH